MARSRGVRMNTLRLRYFTIKTFLLLTATLLTAWIAFAEGPQYIHKDATVNKEFVNVYQDIRAKVPIYSSGTYLSTITASSTYLTQSSASATYLIMSSASAIVVTGAGEVTQKFQPSFLATDAAGATDVTGDSTSYPMLYATEVFDLGSDYAPGSGSTGGTFTAPVDGKYLLTAHVLLGGILVTHDVRFIQLDCSNRDFYDYSSYLIAETYKGFSVSVIADMDANDTATVLIRVQGSTKVVDVNNNALQNYFSGSLIN